MEGLGWVGLGFSLFLLLISCEETLGMTWNRKLFPFSLLGFYELYKYVVLLLGVELGWKFRAFFTLGIV